MVSSYRANFPPLSYDQCFLISLDSWSQSTNVVRSNQKMHPMHFCLQICDLATELAHSSFVRPTLLVGRFGMETSEKWCALKDDCDLPISNGLLDETASGLNPTSDPMSKFPFHLRSVDMLGSSELNLTNSTCVYPFCVAVLSYTIKNTK